MTAVVLALLAVTLVVDAMALAAILFRLTSMGMTPNRIAVIGANLLILAHLGWIATTLVGHWRGTLPRSALADAVGGYLPVYTLWSVVVVVLLPLLFRWQ